MRQTLIVLLAAMMASGAPQAQPPKAAPAPNSQNQPGAAPQAAQPAGEPVKFSSLSQLVEEMVSVKDKQGKVIEGLTEKDFVVTEDGKPQTVSFVQYMKLEEIPDEPETTAASAAAVKPTAPEIKQPPVASVTKNQIAAEKPGDIRYKNKRLLVLYFDMSSMPVPDQLRALAAARKFIGTQMTRQDLVAMMQYSAGAVKVMQDFTDDKDQLNKQIETLIIGDDQGFIGDPNDAASADTGAAFGQDDSEFNIFNTDRQLAALQTAINMLGSLNEKKSLIYFASGLTLQGVDNQAQMRSTTNSAARANVSLYPVDARGLVASAPLGDVTQGSPGGVGMYSGRGALMMQSRLQRSQDTMYSLAADTGGKALFDVNDLSLGIVNAQKANGSYYILGYYTSNSALDGKFRKISITLKENLSASLDYRKGYFAGKTFNKFTQSDKERQLEDALMLGDPITDLTIQMEVNYFQLNRAEYYVPLVIKIPGRELALARKGGAERTVIDFIGEIKDEYGATIQNIRDKVDMKLSGATAQQWAKVPIQYVTGYTLLPGNYSIKVLARDDETGRIGTYMNKFVVPNLNKEEKRIPISSVVLGSQRVPMTDALFTAGKDKLEAANPLVENGQKLIPSVTRVFSTSKDMYVYLQAYERAATSMQPLVAFVTFYRGQTKAFETPPLPVTDGLDPKSKAVPLRFAIALDKLKPGAYDCQVSVVDPTNQKVNFWQTQVMLVP